jgi:hypothetical protein
MRFLKRWERHGKARAVARVALYLYFSAVILDNQARDSQA